MVPRDGGNTFHGAVFATFASESMESDNLTDDLRARGLRAGNNAKRVGDINISVGGPIIKDRLWFFTTFRRWYADNYLANTFTPAGEQALDDNRLTDAMLRLSANLNQKNRLSVSYDRGWKWRGHRINNFLSASFSDPQADVVQTTWLNYMLQSKFTSTLSSRLIAEVGYTRMPINYNLGFEPGVAPGAIAVFDQTRSTISGVTPRADFDTGLSVTWIGNISYVTGAHNLKAGVQRRSGFLQESFQVNGDMTMVVSNGTPVSVRLYNTPLAHREELSQDLGLFAQDSWKLNSRLTLNLGLRFDRMVMRIPAQGAPGGLWAGPRQFAAQEEIVNWNTWSPRLGFAWDPFGDSKTVIKGGVSKYDRLEGTTLAQNVNPNFIATSTCPWTSLTPPTSPSQLTGCTGFSGSSIRIDPNMKRPYQWEYTVMVQRQIGRNTSVSLGYYGRKFFNLYGRVNQAAPPDQYTPVSITNPLTGEATTVYNQNPATRGKFDIVQQTIPDLFAHYNGVELQFNTRFSKLSAFGGFTYGVNYGTPDGSSADLNNPNALTNLAGNIGFDSPFQIRIGAAYELPYHFKVSGSVRENSGLPQSRAYNVTQAVVPGLTQVTQSIRVVPDGHFRYEWQNLFDFRFSREFRFRERFQFEPIIDLFNVFNTNAITSQVTTIGSSLGTPSAIIPGRLLRLGAKFNF
jgi:hypothetical protein